MRNVFGCVFVMLLCANATRGASQVRTVVIYEGKETELAAASPFGESQDLWVTMPDLRRATGFVVKPQGVCREEQCFPLPKQSKSDFLAKRGNMEWFNLSEFARLLNQPVARDEKLSAWYFGVRAETQNGYLSSLAAPNFTLPDVKGTRHALSDFRGKKVLLITWASW